MEKFLGRQSRLVTVPAVKNRAKNAWIRWGSIIAGSALLSTGLVLAVINDEQPVRGVGIAMSIIGTIGIGISYAF